MQTWPMVVVAYEGSGFPMDSKRRWRAFPLSHYREISGCRHPVEADDVRQAQDVARFQHIRMCVKKDGE